MSEDADGSERLKASAVWIDASVYRAQRFDWQGRAFRELAGLAGKNLIRVVTTEITVREVHSLMREMWAEANKGIQAVAAIIGQVGLQTVAETFADEEKCLGAMRAHFQTWLTNCRGLKCDTVPDLDTVLEDYFSGTPPFGRGKKAEFPDALVVSSLRKWCIDHGRTVYIVTEDADIQACCTHGGPLISTRSLNEVLSHGRGSAAIHDALFVAVQANDFVRERLWRHAEDLEVIVRSGYRHGARVEIEAGGAKMYDADVSEVAIDTVEGDQITCTAYIDATLEVRIDVDQEAVQMSEDEWDPGFRHSQRIFVPVSLPATVTATLLEDNEIQIDDAILDDSKVHLDFEDVARQLD
jgi:hypothetical protein